MSMDSKKINILLIEDDADDIVLVQQTLSQANGVLPKLTLECVHRLDSAFERLARGGIDIVVLDLFLPDARGLDALIQLHSHAADVPVVVLTAHHDELLGVEAVSKGAQDYLVKGHVNKHVLVRTIHYAIERHRIRRRLLSVTKELREVNARLENQILMDPLTGLLNRRGMQEALSREIRWAQRDASDVLAVILDLDNFKEVNDSLGHAVGDVVLREVSGKLKVSIRATDYLARIGGDEFLILMPKTKFAEGIQVAEKIRLAISMTPISLASVNESFKMTASVGLIPVSGEIVSIDELLARSHLLLYKSKKRGKNRVSYDEGGKKETSEETSLLSHILQTIRQGDRYRVVKQPIFNLQDSSRVGYEFLSRLSIEGFEMPNDFFRVCLENNILTLVDFQCFKNCVASSIFLFGEGRFHINLFPSTLIDIPIKHLVESFPMDRPRGTYCIEISEQQIIGDPSNLADQVRIFKKSGVLVAIDDVGFGRSCLESLILLEPDIVKIDKRWVYGIAQNHWSARSLKRLLKVTEALGAEVVAEGIELEEDLQVLRELGIRYGQGYLLGRPD